MGTKLTDPLMGTLAWAERSNGTLNETEKVALARNVSAVKAEMVFDEFRHRLGAITPSAIDLDTLAPPDSKLVRDADAYARSMCSDIILAHSLRTYYFGALVAAFDKIKFDREVFYAAAICHDVGVNGRGAAPVSSCCFAHSGGRLTHDHLLQHGHTEVALRVGDAISTHMNIFVPLSEYPAESTLTAVGASCDVLGAWVRRINPTTLAAVVQQWPRAGLLQTFGSFFSQKHLENSRSATLGLMGAFAGGGSHPIEDILATIV